MAHRKGKKNRKHGRNKRWCEVYKMRGTRERNKLKRVLRYLILSLRHIKKRLDSKKTSWQDKARLTASQRKLELEKSRWEK